MGKGVKYNFFNDFLRECDISKEEAILLSVISCGMFLGVGYIFYLDRRDELRKYKSE